jgi:pimeloyl-ACP methyl ester carboxylesterase
MSRGRFAGAVLVGVVLALVLGAAAPVERFGERLAAGEEAQAGLPEFYSAPPLTAPVRAGRAVKIAPVVAPPAGAKAWRVIYESTDQNGTPTLVSGTVIAPTGRAPAGGRTIVAWGHPTSGIAARCAPSVGVDPFFFIEGLRALLRAGYVVAASDYSGMGIAGPPSFLLGDVEGANVLVIARAARSVAAAHAGNRVVLWGHSQGGQAVLFAAQRARSYAPDLHVAGVAVAAPATDLADLLSADIDDVSGVTIASYAFTSYAAAYATQLPHDAVARILTPTALRALPEMAGECLFGQNQALHAIAKPLVGSFLLHDPGSDPTWGPLLTANGPSSARLPVPLFVAQGGKDTLVRPAITAAYVAAQKAAGTAVESHVFPKATHGTVATDAVPVLLRWMAALP